MLKNIAAGKVAIGPLNTSNSKIVTVLTPQAELTAANTEIKWLQELLKTRDTPISSDNLLDRLATVLKALAQYIVLAPSQSAKVTDPLLLTDRTNPIFDN